MSIRDGRRLRGPSVGAAALAQPSSPTRRGVSGWPSALIGAVRGGRLADAARAFDNDPRVIGAGFAVGIVLLVLMALGADAKVPWIGRLLLPVSIVAPSLGVTVIATLALMRETAGLDPLGVQITIIGACALGALVRVALAGLAGRRVTVRFEFLAIAAYVGLSVFQYIWGARRFSADRELYAQYALDQMVSGMLLMITVAVIFTSRGRRWLLAAMVPGIVVAAGLAVISLSPEIIRLLPVAGLLPKADISARGTGVFYNPNYLGAAMAIAVMFVARAGRMQLPGLARWSAVIGLLVTLGLLASFSRGALVAVVAAIVVLYARRGRRPFVAATVVGALVITAGYQLLLGSRHLLNFGSDVAAAEAAQVASDASRLAVYRAGLRMFLQDPAFGVGYAQFHYVSVHYLPGATVTYPHNIYLGVAVEQGLPGIVLFLILIGAVGYALIRARDEVAVTAGAMFVAFLVGSLFDDSLTVFQATGILWVALGAALVSSPPLGYGIALAVNDSGGSSPTAVAARAQGIGPGALTQPEPP